jgi:opacity protein-like surface antigen
MLARVDFRGFRSKLGGTLVAEFLFRKEIRSMAKLVLSTAAMALVLAGPGVAAAQPLPNESQPPCPPGSWFCAEPPQQRPTPAGQSVTPLQQLPDPDEGPPSPPPPPPGRRPPVTYQPAPRQPPVIVYPPPPPPAPPFLSHPEFPPPYDYAPRPRPQISPSREWGLNVHLMGAMIGHGTLGDAGLGGAGLGLRYKPSRYFGVETDLDFLGGRGYAGDTRNETALGFNALLFLNPRSRAQFYLLAGFGWSWAHSVCDTTIGADCPGGQSVDANYSYFGGQAGFGLELRLSRVLALDADFRGFVRGRTDAQAQLTPEFTDSSGRTTNTSGGALLTGGITLYF